MKPNFSKLIFFFLFFLFFGLIHSNYKFGLILNLSRTDSDLRLTSDLIGMKLFGADINSGMIRKISDWFGMNLHPKLSPEQWSESGIDCL